MSAQAGFPVPPPESTDLASAGQSGIARQAPSKSECEAEAHLHQRRRRSLPPLTELFVERNIKGLRGGHIGALGATQTQQQASSLAS